MSKLLWYDAGFGFCPADTPVPYDLTYFENYVSRSSTEFGKKLTEARIELVRKYIGDGPLVDIGIGSGHFLLERGASITSGYDVNPVAIRMLLEKNIWHDPFFKSPENASCWDSLEHMLRPDRFLDTIDKILFVSIPIFKGRDHAAGSKHFKPGEHFWYFTQAGFISWMKTAFAFTFELIEKNRMESDLGREDIETFVFRRSKV